VVVVTLVTVLRPNTAAQLSDQLQKDGTHTQMLYNVQSIAAATLHGVASSYVS